MPFGLTHGSSPWWQVSALSNDLDLMIPQNSPVPEGATHLLVFSRNAYGEYASPGSLLLRDAALPKAWW